MNKILVITALVIVSLFGYVYVYSLPSHSERELTKTQVSDAAPAATDAGLLGEPVDAGPPKPVFKWHFGENDTMFFTASKDKYVGRSRNINRLVEIIMETDRVLEPGEEWSFNDTIGPRTKDKGFVEAPVIAFGEMVPGIGGGSCQVSSTIFGAAIRSGLEITFRRPHSRPPGYTERGMDATVSYPEACNSNHRENTWNGKNEKCPALDLRFKNPYDHPIQLHIRAEDGQTHNNDKKPWLLYAEFYGTKAPPFSRISTQWQGFSAPDYTKKQRVTNKWRTDRKKLVQVGHPGLNGALQISTKYPGGQIKSKRIVSEYPPVTEIWEVGLGYDMAHPPWTTPCMDDETCESKKVQAAKLLLDAVNGENLDESN